MYLLLESISNRQRFTWKELGELKVECKIKSEKLRKLVLMLDSLSSCNDTCKSILKNTISVTSCELESISIFYSNY